MTTEAEKALEDLVGLAASLSCDCGKITALARPIRAALQAQQKPKEFNGDLANFLAKELATFINIFPTKESAMPVAVSVARAWRRYDKNHENRHEAVEVTKKQFRDTMRKNRFKYDLDDDVGYFIMKEYPNGLKIVGG